MHVDLVGDLIAQLNALGENYTVVCNVNGWIVLDASGRHCYRSYSGKDVLAYLAGCMAGHRNASC